VRVPELRGTSNPSTNTQAVTETIAMTERNEIFMSLTCPFATRCVVIAQVTARCKNAYEVRGSLTNCTSRLPISVSLCGAQQLSGLLDARHRQLRRIQQSDLYEQRGLVPPGVLVRNFPVLEFHHHHVRKFHSPARGSAVPQRAFGQSLGRVAALSANPTVGAIPQ